MTGQLVNRAVEGVFLASFLIAIVIVGLFTGATNQRQRVLGTHQGESCIDVPSGLLQDGFGETISLGMTNWGYDYQNHQFGGSYCDAVFGAGWCTNNQVELSMNWNDAWLANTDCNADGSLDTHAGYANYVDSGAWLTNRMTADYVGVDGKVHTYSYFAKVSAVPAGAHLTDGFWYTRDGKMVGEAIWSEFAIVESGLQADFAPDNLALPALVRPSLGSVSSL